MNDSDVPQLTKEFIEAKSHVDVDKYPFLFLSVFQGSYISFQPYSRDHSQNQQG